MLPPKITFAIPFYSNLFFLTKAISSVISQTRGDWSCIVLDDAGPNPEAKEFVEGLKDERITYYRAKENGGLAVNWNRCLDIPTTELIMLLHADDELKPDFMAASLEFIARHPDASGYFCNADIINEDGHEVFSVPDVVKKFLRPRTQGALVVHGDTGLASIMRGNYIMCPTMIYRRSKLQETRFSNKWKMVLDLDLFSLILLQGESLIGNPMSLYRYRRHAENQTSKLTTNTVRFVEELNIYDQIGSLARGKDWALTAKVCRRKIIIKLNLCYQICQRLIRGRPGETGPFRKLLKEIP